MDIKWSSCFIFGHQEIFDRSTLKDLGLFICKKKKDKVIDNMKWQKHNKQRYTENNRC